MNNPKFFDLKSLGMSEDKQIFDWRAYWHIFKRRKFLIFISGILGGLAGLFIILSVVRKYESTTSILVEGSKLMTKEVRKVIPGVTANNEIAALTRYATSTACIVGLINTLGLTRNAEIHKTALDLNKQFPDRTLKEIEDLLFIDDIRKRIAVTSKGRDIVQISALDEDPETAYLMAKTLSQVFIQESQKRQLGSIRGAREFSEEQLAIYKDKLQKSQENLKKFQEGLLQNQMDDAAHDPKVLNRLKTEISTIEINIQSKKNRLRQLGKKLPANTLPRLQKTHLNVAMENDLFAKSRELAINLKTFNWNSPQILRINNDINRLRNQIRDSYRKQLRAAPNRVPTYQIEPILEQKMTQLDIRILQTQRDELQKLSGILETSIAKSPAQNITLQNLQQEVEQNRQIYLNFLNQARGTQIEEEVQRKDAEFRLQIMEPAKKPLYPKGLGRNIILLLSIFGGLGVGVGIVIGLEFIDQSVKDVHEVEKEFHLPVWGVIPNLDEFRISTWKREGMIYILLVFATAIAATLIVIIKKGNLL